MRIDISCKAILFDMDGTLVDSTSVIEFAWRGWALRHNISPEAVLAFSHGRKSIDTMQYFFPERDHTEEQGEFARYEETNFEGIVAVPGAIDVLEAMKGQRWAIVTSAWRTLAAARIKAAGLPSPKVLVPADEIRDGKPAPEGFLRAAKTLGVQPKDCLVFEDTRPGIEAGLAAGMQVVGLLTTNPSQNLRHSPLIRDFRDVTIQPTEDYLQVELRG